MSHITYEGVVAGAQGGGDIFQGKRFWVALRVPIRSTIINHITASFGPYRLAEGNNGGIVEKLEKNADFLIADHARNDAPTDSYSWKLIEDSVENGIMQLPDRYYNGASPGKPKPAGSGGPTKHSRTPFTHTDDVMLAKWVLSKEDNVQGNSIYKELEELCPQHSWQSWRNRYVKNLSNRGQECLMKLASEELPVDIGGSSGTTAVPKVAAPPPASSNQEDDRASNGSESESRSIENDETESEEYNFYNNLAKFHKNDDILIEHPVRDRLVDRGRLVGLWNLKNVICKQELPAEEVDWIRVAKELYHDWDGDEETCEDLRACFDKYLANFIKDFGNADQPEPQATNSDEQQHLIPRSPPSSPPRTPRRKRSHDADAVEPSTKRRRRLPRDVEIPSTPEEKIGISRRLPTEADEPSADEQLPALTVTDAERPQDEESPSPSQQLLSETRFSDTTHERGQKTPVADEAEAKATPHRQLPRSFGGTAAVSPQGTTKTPRQNPQSVGSSSTKPSPRGQERRKQPRSTVGSGSGAGKRATSSGEQAIMEHVQHYVSLGYSERNVMAALKSTSLRPGGAASFVMQSLKEGKGIPTNVEGAWTERDDQDLLWADEVKARGSSASEAEVKKANDKHKRLNHKHGSENLKLRRRFVADLAAVSVLP
ncbi:hypothetical protein CP533_3109 [Ophiocordyceps camponoti-saundersi (nom. inval.)]|nr:hypothetical protein CP533_3109 [Ophiocordyceps camponoti-saundersi (nom. inval.)]